MFIFQTPVHLKEAEKKNISKILGSDKPSAVFASPAGGLDRDISAILGMETSDTAISDLKCIGTLNYKTDGIYNSLPNTFPVFQPFTNAKFKEGSEIIYSVFNSPCLVYNESDRKQLIFWNPPEFYNNLENVPSYGESLSLDQRLGSPTPYVLTARLINETMKKSGLISTDDIEQYHPVNLSMWQLKDGSCRVMAGNLEEGINHTADLSVQTTLNLTSSEAPTKISEVVEMWNGEKLIISNNRLTIYLSQAQTKLFKFK
jgi:hypothetical protein